MADNPAQDELRRSFFEFVCCVCTSHSGLCMDEDEDAEKMARVITDAVFERYLITRQVMRAPMGMYDDNGHFMGEIVEKPDGSTKFVPYYGTKAD